MSVALGPGTTFAGYQIESVVGRGGMGVVYRATDLSLERPVALKLIAPELAEDEQFRRRFLKEPKLAAALDHPNVVPIYEAGEREGQLYLAMRFVEGSDMRTLLRRDGGLSHDRALVILAQVASALDAAHRRGLVHRDVKPANVLVDDDGHAYLTDFGVTKQLGGDTTETGQIVGTLDYLAPEQIRGEAVDGRADEYALACVLYECFASTAPFHGATEAETLWAHMQNPVPPVPGHPALDPVLRKALAKEPEDRYESCAELIEAARLALAGVRVPAGLVRRRRLILAAGLLVLACTTAGAIVALTTGDGSAEQTPIGNGIAVIDPAAGRVETLIGAATAPSNVAVGEGAVWVLNTEDHTVSRIDPETNAVTASFRPRGVPTDLAAGAGAVWVGNGGGASGNFTVSISRVDPRTRAVTRTVKLGDQTDSVFTPSFSWGFPGIAVGAGAVWATNPTGTVSRIDPATGRIVATIDADAGPIAAGEEGVWFIGGPGVERIDPRTNRTGQRIPIGSQSPSGIAVGAGSVWVTAEEEGLVWRIEPGPDPGTRSIDVGAGVTYIAYGAGAVWTANYIDGIVSRIDPRTNAITARIPIGAAHALAAGAGSVWVSTAGGTAAGTLPASTCGDIVSGGVAPDVLIASDLPLQGPDAAGPRAMADAIRLVLRQRGFRAGRYAVGYSSCDDSTAQTGAYDNRRCAANANAYARADQLVSVIGPYNSYCAQIQIPLLNRAPGGPLAMISPTNSYPGLTRGGFTDGPRGIPDVLYPTGVRNYVRLAPGDDLLGAAHAVLAEQLGLKRVYVIHDGSNFWRELHVRPFRRAAGNLGVGIAGSATFDPKARSYRRLAEEIARSRAQGIVIAADQYGGGHRLLKDLRARLGAGVTIMAGQLFTPIPDLLEGAGPAAHGVYVTTSDVPRTAYPLNAAGRRFARDSGASGAPLFGVLEAGQATELVLDAIERSDGTRASVLAELRASEVKDGILGSFNLDRNGDVAPAAVPILRVTGSTPPGSGLSADHQGAVVDRVVQVPPSLVN